MAVIFTLHVLPSH